MVLNMSQTAANSFGRTRSKYDNNPVSSRIPKINEPVMPLKSSVFQNHAKMFSKLNVFRLTRPTLQKR
jgi:hypothetical protein